MAKISPKKNSFLNQLFNKDKQVQKSSQDDQMVMDEKMLLEYYSSLALYHPDLIIVLSPERDIISQNQSNINHLLGYLPKKKLNYKKLVSEETYNELFQAFDNTLLGNSERHEITVKNKQDHFLYLDLIFIPIKASTEEIVGVFLIIKDITENQMLTQDLELKEKHLLHAQELAELGSWEYDIEDDLLYCSDNFVQIFGLDQNKNMPIEKALQLVHPDDHDQVRQQLFNSIRKGWDYSADFRIFHGKTKKLRYIKAHAEVIKKDNKPSKLVGVIKDVTQRQNIENKMKTTNQDLMHIFDNLSIGIWSGESVEGKISYASKGMAKILEVSLDELYENPDIWKDMILPIYRNEVFDQHKLLKDGQSIKIKYRINVGDGTTKWVMEQTIPRLNEDGEVTGLFGMVADITSDIEMKEQIEFYATHDSLTMLPNQHSLYQKLNELCRNKKNPFAVFYLDLDRFRVINDSLGYHVGDEVLKKIAKRLISMLPNKGYLARLNSNDFIILMEDYSEKEDVFQVADEIIKCIEKTIMINDFDLHLTTSIGISFFPEDGDNKKTLLETSHSALYQAKKQGKNNYQFYSFANDILSYKRYILERDMRKAIVKEEFEIFYQPQVEPTTGIIQSAEALIRWEHEEWGLISPNEFIPLAEENHLINDIGDWVIREVCMQLREWKDKNLTLRPISINISPVRFFKKGLVELVKEQLELYQIPAKYLEFEITESILLKVDKSVLSTINALKELGVKIAIDDFGTGFSSLTYLRQFPADTLKIDKLFIQSRDGKNEKDAAIVSAVLHLAKGLDMKIVAEGVEEHGQLEFLIQRECDLIQGYLFSKPVPKEKFEKMMQSGYLKPNKPKINNAPDIERRKYYRFEFPFSLRGEMVITEVNNRKVELGKTEILIENISLGGLKIFSSLKLPVNSNMKFRFHYELLKEAFEIDGALVWKNEGKGITSYYGVQFDMTEVDQDRLAKIINTMTTLRKNNQEILDTDFIQEDGYLYLMKNSN